MYSGGFSIAGGCVPAHAAYFSMYEFLQKKFNVVDEEHHPIEFGVIGALATFAHEFILTPFDVIK